MSKPGKATLNHGLVPVDLKGAKEPLPHQTVMKIFSISIIAQGLPFCRRRVSLTYLQNLKCLLKCNTSASFSEEMLQIAVGIYN